MRQGHARHGVVDLGSLAAGFSRDEVLTNYPGIRAEDIDAALAFAADLASYQTISA